MVHSNKRPHHPHNPLCAHVIAPLILWKSKPYVICSAFVIIKHPFSFHRCIHTHLYFSTLSLSLYIYICIYFHGLCHYFELGIEHQE